MGEFMRATLGASLVYAARVAPEIAHSIDDVDRAMRWGFGWELGPFEIWDAIGLKSSLKKIEKEGDPIPPLVEKLLSKGYSSFYERKDGHVSYFDLGAGQYEPLEEKPEIILLPSLKDRNKTILSNPGASLIDLGDGVACLEFHSKMNSIGADTVQMIRRVLK